MHEDAELLAAAACNARPTSVMNSFLPTCELSLHALDPDPHRGPLTILDVKGFPLRDMTSFVEVRGKEMSVVAKAFYHYQEVAKSLRVPPVSDNRYA